MMLQINDAAVHACEDALNGRGKRKKTQLRLIAGKTNIISSSSSPNQ